jgi:hypothetical protein
MRPWPKTERAKSRANRDPAWSRTSRWSASRRAWAVDWMHRDAGWVRIRVLLKQSVPKYAHPPDFQEGAVHNALQSADVRSGAWGASGLASKSCPGAPKGA